MSRQRRKRKRLLNKGSKRAKRHYDVEMIRDFLDHLLWELRINHLENTNPGCEVNPELCNQLAKYIKKYNTAGLMAAMSIDTDGVPEDVAEQALRTFHIARAQSSQEAIDALESLEQTFEVAFKCASNPDCFMVNEITLGEVLDKSED
ncbi:MAG: hypothetical protein ACYS74_08140 [Planctomycetota bacterium]|jgi:radical SAM superfamily enzyme with C-terminal helix-hairpin-helix motif